jgi:Secretion system C-terminal sorting domain
MKKIILLLFSIKNMMVFAQTPDAKRDHVWLFGYDSAYHLTNPKSGNTIVDFNIAPSANYFEYSEMNFNDDIAIISDTSGQLLFYTNGVFIADKTHKAMENGKGLNFGQFSNLDLKYGCVLPQGSLILPKPNSNDLYYLFHTYDIFDGKVYKGENLFYTLIDMNLNEGKGAVIEKNKVIIGNKPLDNGKLTACRHANGKDWWIIMYDFDTKKINTILLTANDVEVKDVQLSEKSIENGGFGQAHFTPDGTKYIRYNAFYTYRREISIFDFDRCSGKLSNERHFEYNKDTTVAVGMSISPNSKYLYVSTNRRIYQYDLTAEDIFSTIDTVAIYDGFKDPDFGLSTTFYLHQLAPDGKIYITIPNTTMFLHVIHEPNKKGKACNVEQHGFKLARKNYTTMPNFPNFRLGAAAQPCESVSVAEVTEAKEKAKIYPNPSDGNFIFDSGKLSNTAIIIYDMSGKVVLSQNISDKLTPINVAYLSNGLYYCRVVGEENIIKFTIMH